MVRKLIDYGESLSVLLRLNRLILEPELIPETTPILEPQSKTNIEVVTEPVTQIVSVVVEKPRKLPKTGF